MWAAGVIDAIRSCQSATGGKIEVRKTALRSTSTQGVIMSASQNVETAKKSYEAFSAGDLETAMSTLDDSIEWFNPGDTWCGGSQRP